jgi:hypothetical protein
MCGKFRIIGNGNFVLYKGYIMFLFFIGKPHGLCFCALIISTVKW